MQSCQAQSKVEESALCRYQLCKDRIKSLDSLGFQWKSEFTFDERMKELSAFKNISAIQKQTNIVVAVFY